jgi:hypothetical protein
MLTLLLVLAWAPSGPAQETPEAEGGDEGVFTGFLGPTYTGVDQSGSTRAAEYDYLKSSLGGDLYVEYAPLPQRFSVESHYLNPKDYFGEMDYAYRDLVMLNILTRSVYHNLDHLSFGADDPATQSPSFTDRDPGDTYALQNTLQRGSLRFKTPDFPLHFSVDATTIDRTGTIQQRFLRGFSGGLDLASESRDIDWSSREVRMGMNSHLGPVEFDYRHAEKIFEAGGPDKELFDVVGPLTVPHNLTPDLTSSSDTVKLHTSYTGRVTAAATYSDGDKKNQDSNARADFRNAAGDLTLTPAAGLVFVVKYRHYGLSPNTPDATTIPGTGTATSVEDAISSKRDVLSGLVRYRLTDRLTARGEYAFETTDRSAGLWSDEWDVARRTTKTTEKLVFTYRAMRRLSLKADVSAAQVANPAYADDPDRVHSGKATVTWTPGPSIVALASYGSTREKRDDLSAPLSGGSRSSGREQALASLTLPAGSRSTVTASWFSYNQKTVQTLTFTDSEGLFLPEEGVPYGDKADIFSLSGTHALSEALTAIADASRSFSRGSFRTSGTVSGTEGLDILTDLRVVEDILTAGLELQLGKQASCEVRLQHRRYDDRIDDAEDGRMNAALASLYVKW